MDVMNLLISKDLYSEVKELILITLICLVKVKQVMKQEDPVERAILKVMAEIQKNIGYSSGSV